MKKGGREGRLRLLDPFSQTEKVPVDTRVGPKKATVLLKQAPADGGQNYTITAAARGFRDVAIYPVKARPGRLSHTAVMLVRKDAEADFSNFSFERPKEFSPAFEAALQAGGITEDDFAAVDPERSAAALNIEGKLPATMPGGTSAVEDVRDISGVEDLRKDRIFCKVKPETPGEVLRNKIVRQKPDPYTVYVQLFDQRSFPLYTIQA